MNLPSIEHSTFVIERELPGNAAHAFRFWSDARLKALWNSCHPDWAVLEDIFDFRPGGSETKRWRTAEGHEQTFAAHYFEIVPERRIIYAYHMGFMGQALSASLATVEFAPTGGGRTRMTFTEQVAFLGETNARQRIEGTEQGFDRLIEAIAKDLTEVH